MKVFSLFTSYLFALAVVILITSVFMNRSTPQVSPTVHSVKYNEIVFTPNLDLKGTDNYNVREVYLYLVHRVEDNGKIYEKTVWDRLIKKENSLNLKKKEKVSVVPWRGNTLRKGTLVLKGSYFHYIGVVKEKKFSEFDPKISQ